MLKVRERLAISAALTMCAGSVLAGPVGTVTQFRLSDHPDGLENPPPYGLRFDGLFGGSTVTSFSIGQGTGTILTVTDDGLGGITININGVLFGGEAVGGTYTAHEGLYEVDFTYRMHAVASGTGWRVNDDDASNNGTLTALTGTMAGSSWDFSDVLGVAPGYSFAFLQDNHRLAGHSQFGQDYWVGRGWLQNGVGTGVRDWLFLGQFIPLPGTAGLAIGGLGLLAFRRRR